MSTPERVVLATKNADKAAEMRAVLAEAVPRVSVVDGLDWPDVEETGSTLEENALLKARAVVAATGLAAIADDTGLEVDALDGAPGVRTSRYAGSGATYSQNRRALLEALGEEANRVARFRTVVVMVKVGGSVLIAEGILEGAIARTERGSWGFGYDPIFEVDGRTLAEIPEDEKNRISHRGRALRALAVRLASGG